MAIEYQYSGALITTRKQFLLAARLGADNRSTQCILFTVLSKTIRKNGATVHILRKYMQGIFLKPRVHYQLSLAAIVKSADIIEIAARNMAARRGTSPLLMMLENEPSQAYGGPLLMMFGDQSEHYNPFLREVDPITRWRSMHSNVSWGIVRGTHGSYFREPGIIDLTRFLRQAVDAMESSGQLPDSAMCTAGGSALS